MELYQLNNGKLRIELHPGQTRAWDSIARFVAIIAGTQSGKTSFVPIWLQREIQNCGNGDYLAATATYDLFKLKFLPEMRRFFEGMFGWSYFVSDRVFHSPESISIKGMPTMPAKRIILRSAEAQGGLESASIEAAALDEFGYPSVKVDAWEAVQRRLSLSEGRALFSTTPYNMGYLKTEVYDRWKAGDPDFDIINFKSTMNPAFPREEYERMKRKMPLWKFRMFYDGIFEKPAGIIYDTFGAADVCPRFRIPDKWQRYLGLDFGGVNMVGNFYAEEPGTGKFYLYRTYKEPKKTAADHVTGLLRGEPMIPITVGGAPSEGQWRMEFRAGGLPVKEPPIKDVEVGIDRVYEAHKEHSIIVFEDLLGYLEEIRTYSRKVDESTGEPTEEIENKDDFHYMDADRYIFSFIKRKGMGTKTSMIDWYKPITRNVIDQTPDRTEDEIDRLLKGQEYDD